MYDLKFWWFFCVFFLIEVSLTEFPLKQNNDHYAEGTSLDGSDTAASETEKYLSSWNLHLKMITCVPFFFFFVFQNSRASDQEQLKAMKSAII